MVDDIGIVQNRMEIQLSEGESVDSINRFKPAIFVCISRVRTWISNALCCERLYVQWFNVVVHFVDIVDSLDFIFALIQDFNSTF